MKRFLIHYLHFSRKERIGALLLSIICAAVFAFPDVARRFYNRPSSDFSGFESDIRAFRQAAATAATQPGELWYFDPNTVSAEDFVRLGLSEKVAGTICNYRSKGGRFRAPEDLQKIWSLPPEDYNRLLPYIRIASEGKESFDNEPVVANVELFSFDPNVATEQDFRRMGLPSRTIKSILNYREKGGYFRKKADFQKIYTLGADDYRRLEPYMAMDATVSLESPRPVVYSGGNRQAFAATNPVDINQADEETWQRLPGIGEKRAQQIVKFRTSLGGFLSVEQVGELYGLPDSVFQRIRPLLMLDRAVPPQRIDLNAATVETLDAHPYISTKQAKLIVSYRDQHGAFAAVDDLSRIAAFSDRKWLEKIKPYLRVD